MISLNAENEVSFEQFCQEWLVEVKEGQPSSLDIGRRFATKLITQWLDVTTDDDDLIICDGSGDGGIDIAYLHRSEGDDDQRDDQESEPDGDTWYLVQSKYGTAFAGKDTIVKEGLKVIDTLRGDNQRLNACTRSLMQKLDTFRQKGSPNNRIVLVFATTEPIAQDDRGAISDITDLGRQHVAPNFSVAEVSLATIWDDLEPTNQPSLAIPMMGRFVEQTAGLMIGTVSLTDLFEFMQSYKRETGDLDHLYEKNVRRYLGRKKVSQGMAKTLNDNPEKFGLYNNGITIVVSGYEESDTSGEWILENPYVVNGCQTTRTIYDVLDPKLRPGGQGVDPPELIEWKERAGRGGVVTKIVHSDESEIRNITRFTNSQNRVTEKDFIALHDGFQGWKAEMARDYGLFLEIQRGGWESHNTWQQQHPEQPQLKIKANAFELIKVFGAGWLSEPGTAFGKNQPFLPLPPGPIYTRMISRERGEEPFGIRDLNAAYRIQQVANGFKFGRNPELPSRAQSRFLFYHVFMKMLSHVIVMTTELQQPAAKPSELTDAVIKLTAEGAEEAFNKLSESAVGLIDQYMNRSTANCIYNEEALALRHNGDLNAFLKSERVGKDATPLLNQALLIHNEAFNLSGGRPLVADALLKG